jgi:hypothetical protein
MEDAHMTLRIFDMNGQEKDFAWLRSKYGNVVLLDAGEVKKFELVRIDETQGVARINVRVLSESGQNVQAQPVANHWPDDTLPDLRQSQSLTLWHERAYLQATDASGSAGYDLGPGSYIVDLLTGGPHTLWVVSGSLPSDGLSGVGMLGGTHHHGPLSLTFQIMDESTPGPLAPQASANDMVMERLDEVMES